MSRVERGAGWALRVVVAAGPPLALLATWPAGQAPRPLLVAVVVLLSLGFAVRPDSSAGTASFVIVLAWWGVGLRDGLHPAALVAAAALLASHLAALLVASGPARSVLDRDLVRVWLRRGAGLLLLAPVAFAAALAGRSAPAPPLLWVTGLVAVTGAALIAGLSVTVRGGR